MFGLKCLSGLDGAELKNLLISHHSWYWIPPLAATLTAKIHLEKLQFISSSQPSESLLFFPCQMFLVLGLPVFPICCQHVNVHHYLFLNFYGCNIDLGKTYNIFESTLHLKLQNRFSAALDWRNREDGLRMILFTNFAANDTHRNGLIFGIQC